MGAVIVVAAAVLTSCGGHGSKNGWLASNGDKVVFAQWREGPNGSLVGTGRMIEVVTGAQDPYTITDRQFTLRGTKDRDELQLFVGEARGQARWFGNQHSSWLLLNVPVATGTETLTFHPASLSGYDKAADRFRQLISAQGAVAGKWRQAPVDDSATAGGGGGAAGGPPTAAQAADDEARESKIVEDANTALHGAVDRLTADTEALGSPKFDPNTYLRPVESAYRQVQATEQQQTNDASASPPDCGRVSHDAKVISVQLGTMTQAKMAFDTGIKAINTQVIAVNADISAAQGALGTFNTIVAENRHGRPLTTPVTPDAVGVATAIAGQKVIDKGSAVLGSVQAASGFVTDGASIGTQANRTAAGCTAPAAPAAAAATAPSAAPVTSAGVETTTTTEAPAPVSSSSEPASDS